MQQLSRALGRVDTLVNHAVSEIQGGANVQHVLREVALMGALVGAGISADRAIREVERAEAQLVGGTEQVEAGYHQGVAGQAYGMPMYTGQAYGKQTGQVYGVPMGVGQTFGVPTGIAQTYGKQMGLGQAYGMPMGVGQTFGKPMYGAQSYMTPGTLGAGINPMAAVGQYGKASTYGMGKAQQMGQVYRGY